MPKFEFCEPNCPRRKPGCQDHCEFHAERKRIFYERKAQLNAYAEANQYTHEAKARNFDRRIKRTKTFRKGSWRSTQD